MKKPSITIAVSLLMMFSQIATASTEEAIASAEKARMAVAQVGYEWRDTAQMIKKARELANKGHSAEAIKLAKRAEEQSLDALKQYHSEMKRYTNNH